MVVGNKTLDPHSIPRVAVIGCGIWGSNHIRDFHSLGALAAVSDIDKARAQKMADRYGVSCYDFDEICSNDEIDAVVITTPADTHYDVAHAALCNNKHVFVEKPLSLSMYHSQALFDLAASKKRCLMVGHLFHYHPIFKQMVEIVQKGQLGQLRHIYASRVNTIETKREHDVLWGFAPHDVAMVIALAGMPEAVEARGPFDASMSFHDDIHIDMSYANALKAHIHVSWAQPIKRSELIIIGSHGALIFDNTQPWAHKLRIVQEEADYCPKSVDFSTASYVDVKEENALFEECHHFLCCIQHQLSPITGRKEALNVQRVLDMAHHARRPEPMSHQHQTYIMQHPQAYIHPTSYVHPTCRLGDVYVGPYCHIDEHCQIEDGTVLKSHAAIGPYVHIAKHCSLAPGCVITGKSAKHPVKIMPNQHLEPQTVIDQNHLTEPVLP